ncbi:cephalosporin hydroxylase family protein [Candidatus Lokiarchaeum ossiferum]|uniref:cephalosporin hydroxylase family protein n=1 Tax=Candidatus Lokiarchaeum ossiferum TaxID=2951803 RepID=UPI00352D9678
MDPIEEFKKERAKDMELMSKDKELSQKSIEWMIHAEKYKYTYNYSWLGRPIIKYPNDIVLQQEIIWEFKPDLIIETGIAHGGSIILSASMLELLGGDGLVVGVDIDIRKHNRDEIEKHPLFKRIKLIEGSSTSDHVMDQIRKIAQNKKRIMVFLDSLHTHDHVLDEMKCYSPFVSVGSYLVVSDTFIEFFPEGHYSNRPWDRGDNPYTAVQEFLSENDGFEIDTKKESKLLITEGISGWLKRIK